MAAIISSERRLRETSQRIVGGILCSSRRHFGFVRGIAQNPSLIPDICVLPVTDEVLLVEDGSVGAEEGVGEEATVHVPEGTHMEGLPKSQL